MLIDLVNMGVFVSSNILYGGIGGHERQTRKIDDVIYSGSSVCQRALGAPGGIEGNT